MENKILSHCKKLFGARKVEIKDRKPFLDFFAFVQLAVQGEKVYLSNQVFQEVWDICQKSKGAINFSVNEKNENLYHFNFIDTDMKNENNIIVKFNPKTDSYKRYQLLQLHSKLVHYQDNSLFKSKGLFFDRPKEQTLEK